MVHENKIAYLASGHVVETTMMTVPAVIVAGLVPNHTPSVHVVWIGGVGGMWRDVDEYLLSVFQIRVCGSLFHAYDAAGVPEIGPAAVATISIRAVEVKIGTSSPPVS